MNASQVKGKRVTGFTDGEEDVVGYRASLPVHQGLGATCNEASCRRAHATHTCPLPSRPLALVVWLQVLTARGATFVDGGNWACNVQHDGQVFTGQNPISATTIGKATAAALASA